MVIIFSISFDITTDIIIEWLNYFQQKYERINELNGYQKKININADYFLNNNISENKVYFRKFTLNSNQKGYASSGAIDNHMDNHIRTEYFNLYGILCDSFDKKKY